MIAKKVNIKLEGITPEAFAEKANTSNTASFHLTADEVFDLEISTRGISMFPDWSLASIPLIYSQYLPFNANNLQLAIDFRSENFEAIQETSLPQNTIFDINLELIKKIINHNLISDSIYDNYIENSQFEEYAIAHNKAIIAHYNSNLLGTNFDMIAELFKHASYLAPNSYWMAYTNFLYMIFLLENNHVEEAISVCNQIVRRELPDQIKSTVLLTLYKTLTMSEIGSNYENDIHDVEENLHPFLSNDETAYEFYTAKSLFQEANMQLEEAQNSLDESLNKIEKNTYVYAKLQISKGDLYIKMAQMGNPHFYTNALQCYHEAVKTINKKDHPLDFANCQMNIGIIYAEMPSVDKKKHIYAGLSQTAFSDALQIYNKIDFPNEYASVCTNMGNTMMRFLPYIDDERFDKIAYYFNEAIQIRTSMQLDEEKAVSLISLLNLYYYRIEYVEEVDYTWFTEMEIIANEILHLTQNDRLIQMAYETLDFVKQKS